MIKIDQNIVKSPRDFRRIVVTQIPFKDRQQILELKNSQEVKW